MSDASSSSLTSSSPPSPTSSSSPVSSPPASSSSSSPSSSASQPSPKGKKKPSVRAQYRHYYSTDKMLPAEVSPVELRVLRNVFRSIDLNGNGSIDREELVHALQRLGLGHDHDEIMALFDKFDRADPHAINFDEFVAFVSSREREIQQVFQELDSNQDGTLNHKEISLALDKLHMKYTNEELRSLIDRMDQNKDKTVSYDEFRHFVMLLPSINIRVIWNAHRIHNGIDIGEDLTIPDEPTRAPQDWWKPLVAGGVAGVISRTCTAPADRLKVMYQAGVKPLPSHAPTMAVPAMAVSSGGGGPSMPSVSSAAAAARASSHASARQPSLLEVCRMITNEGGWRAFYRGNATNCLKIGPESATKFFMYEKMKSVLCKDPDHPVVLERLQAGAIAGAVSQTVIYPLEVAKTRLALASTGAYRGIFHCLSSTIQKEGPRALFRGLGTSITGIIPYAGVDLAVYNTIRDTYSDHFSVKTPSPLVVLSAGAFSSICGQVIAFPLQCMRTKLQAQGMPGRPVRYSGLKDALKQTVEEEGVRGLYRGIGPNFMKAVPAVAISYLVYENTRSLLDNY